MQRAQQMYELEEKITYSSVVKHVGLSNFESHLVRSIFKQELHSHAKNLTGVVSTDIGG